MHELRSLSLAGALKVMKETPEQGVESSDFAVLTRIRKAADPANVPSQALKKASSMIEVAQQIDVKRKRVELQYTKAVEQDLTAFCQKRGIQREGSIALMMLPASQASMIVQVAQADQSFEECAPDAKLASLLGLVRAVDPTASDLATQLLMFQAMGKPGANDNQKAAAKNAAGAAKVTTNAGVNGSQKLGAAIAKEEAKDKTAPAVKLPAWAASEGSLQEAYTAAAKAGAVGHAVTKVQDDKAKERIVDDKKSNDRPEKRALHVDDKKSKDRPEKRRSRSRSSRAHRKPRSRSGTRRRRSRSRRGAESRRHISPVRTQKSSGETGRRRRSSRTASRSPRPRLPATRRRQSVSKDRRSDSPTSHTARLEALLQPLKNQHPGAAAKSSAAGYVGKLRELESSLPDELRRSARGALETQRSAQPAQPSRLEAPGAADVMPSTGDGERFGRSARAAMETEREMREEEIQRAMQKGQERRDRLARAIREAEQEIKEQQQLWHVDVRLEAAEHEEVLDSSYGAGQEAHDESAYRVDDGSEAPANGEARDGSGPAAAGTSDGDREQTLWNWLEDVDNKKGKFLCYYDALKSEFDCDFSQICAAILSEPVGPGALGKIDPSFWEVCGVSLMGHRLLLAKAICALESEMKS
eukprot:gnl/TRDRNA2_/TRDRNA2_156780_c0_seq1.p1 gnl/TRDRNA2_/TRDRNA2_156780_c0~~gnl/TRDRNA2_/TRDRNA2_156780_c0_seq1.p1  ORF type:complete len:643 (+),score=116.09 gnl/TRDRNA2_/TRDRNA2_156780_c0_seq1:2-1930(+)